MKYTGKDLPSVIDGISEETLNNMNPFLNDLLNGIPVHSHLLDVNIRAPWSASH
jgi:hypothetical protein